MSFEQSAAEIIAKAITDSFGRFTPPYDTGQNNYFIGPDDGKARITTVDALESIAQALRDVASAIRDVGDRL